MPTVPKPLTTFTGRDHVEAAKGLTKAQMPTRRWLVRLSFALAFVMSGALVGWAVAAVFASPADVVDSTPFTTAEVVAGEVESGFSANTVAEWTPAPVASNLMGGVVTSVAVTPGQEVQAGSVLYSVNLRPVVIAQGETPAFRSLSRGSTGADVAQLQAMLTALGFYRGAADGAFGGGTKAAVQAWQGSLGITRDGVVQMGDLVFAPVLPLRVILDSKVVARGATLSGGEGVISALPPTPTFRLPVTAAQAAQMPVGTRVEITGPDQQDWTGFVLSQQPQEDSDAIDVILDGVDGAAICGEECESIAATGQDILRSKVVTLEPVSGLTVPSAALQSRGDGTIVVVDESGLEHHVTIVASANGISVVKGVPEGLNVRLPATSN